MAAAAHVPFPKEPLSDEGVFLVERRGAPGAALLRAVREWGAEAGANARDDAGLYA